METRAQVKQFKLSWIFYLNLSQLIVVLPWIFKINVFVINLHKQLIWAVFSLSAGTIVLSKSVHVQCMLLFIAELIWLI